MQFISTLITFLYSLERLDAHDNRLSTLPKELEELMELKVLDTSHNNITGFTGRVYKLGSCPAASYCGLILYNSYFLAFNHYRR